MSRDPPATATAAASGPPSVRASIRDEDGVLVALIIYIRMRFSHFHNSDLGTATGTQVLAPTHSAGDFMEIET